MTNQINKFQILNFLFCLIPLSMALGNTIINLNIIIIIIFGIYCFKLDLIKIKINSFNLFLFLFFIITIISSLLNFYQFNENKFLDNESKDQFFKSLYYLRFLFLFLILSKLIEFDFFNIKYFFYVSSIICLVLAIDLIYQYIFHVDIFGYHHIAKYRKFSGFFGDEYIAGSYLQRFGFFLIYLIYFFKTSKINKNLYYLFFSLLVFVGLIIAGNKMPLLIFMLSLIFFNLITNNSKKIFFLIYIFIFIFFSLYIFFNKTSFNAYYNFINQSKDVIYVFTQRDKINSNELIIKSPYAQIYNSSIDLVLDNKLYGNGIKSFYKPCIKNSAKLTPYRNCGPHPHNYYFEIIISTGLVGFLCFLGFNLILLKKIIISFFFSKNKYKIEKIIFLVPVILLIIELFPFRSSGAFFTTANSTFFFIFVSIVYNLKFNKIKL